MRHTILLAVAILAAATVSAQEKKGEIYMAANAHLDTQWNWTVQQTIGEYLPNTLFQNFRLMEEFPDYKFSFEGAYRRPQRFWGKTSGPS